MVDYQGLEQAVRSTCKEIGEEFTDNIFDKYSKLTKCSPIYSLYAEKVYRNRNFERCRRCNRYCPEVGFACQQGKSRGGGSSLEYLQSYM